MLMSTPPDDNIPDINFHTTTKSVIVSCGYKSASDLDKASKYEAQIIAWQVSQALGLELIFKLQGYNAKVQNITHSEDVDSYTVVFEVHVKATKEVKQRVLAELEDYLTAPLEQAQAEAAPEAIVPATFQLGGGADELIAALVQSVDAGYFPFNNPGSEN